MPSPTVQYQYANGYVGAYLYERIGYDRRMLQLLPGGQIGEGAAGAEKGWRIADGKLIISGDHGDICELTAGNDRVWRGRWMQFERMPINLIPERILSHRALGKDSGEVCKPGQYHYITNQQFTADCVAFARTTLRGIKAIAGVPRSGVLAASIIALELNVPLLGLDQLMARELPTLPHIRRSDCDISRPEGKIIVIDDSSSSGGTMLELRKRLHPAVMTAEVYGNGHSDFTFQPRLNNIFQSYEWTLLHDSNANYTICDLDGMLCEDWHGDELAEPQDYLRHLQEARPLRIPSYELYGVVTGRRETFRTQTEQWLKMRGIRARHLWMYDAAKHRDSQRVAEFKSDVYRSFPELRLFVESEHLQAQIIRELTGCPVLSFERNCLL